ncbi:pteridine reductase [Aliiglaciecola lipolytica]|uniref:Pteridine reductase n=1 Tax=Aliiglaciecola lipolytica E3 TaxID=1127673 RepID=K6XR31_9ALTE|nr:pteridine reductase [Aliiglaciecola lipolytica]GAC14156.1 pteridine reductase [Aliiglaciecola lipolytica E3]
MKNEVVFITGSAKRIGAYTARHLHSLGYRIVLHCHHSVDQVTTLAEQLNAIRKNSVKWVQGDLCNPEQLKNLAESAINAFDRIDVLINNASAFYATPVSNFNQQDWQALMGSNAQAPLYLIQLLQKQLKENQGVVINMVDIHAQRPLSGHTIYCMAKAALVTLTQSMAQELAPLVRVNGVAPGAILWPDNALPENEKNAILKQIPLGRLGCEKDISEAIAFLISAPYITGQILAVDGGRSIANPSVA